MLKTLHIQHFTVFQDARFDFSPGLNIVIGDNGTGKTHLLKLAYLFCRAWPDLTSKRLRVNQQRAETYLDDRLANLFRVSDLGELVRQGYRNEASLDAVVGAHIPTLQIHMPSEPTSLSPGLDEPMPWHIRIKQPKNESAKVEAVTVPDAAATNAFVPRPVFVPSKEMVSLFKGLIALFEKYREFPLDETYLDLAVAMSTLEPREPSILLPEVMQSIQKLLGGNLRLENGDLIFERADGSRLESQLLAEGHRKLAMLIYLLHYGVIELGSTVFWDEPEANLNPAALKLLAEALFVLSGLGVQVILATHSLFLLREFEILSLRTPPPGAAKPRYFGLGLGKKGVMVSSGDNIEACDPLVLLDEDLTQSERFMETLK